MRHSEPKTDGCVRSVATTVLCSLLFLSSGAEAQTLPYLSAPPAVAWGGLRPGQSARAEPSTGAVEFAQSLAPIASRNVLGTFGRLRGRVVPAGREAALGRLRARAGTNVVVSFRADNGTVMQIRGARLEPAPSGFLPATAASLAPRAAMNFLQANGELLGLSDPSQELSLAAQDRDDDGSRSLRYEQRYADLPVWPAGINVHLDPRGNVTLFEGAYIPTPRGLNPGAAVPAEAAVRRARNSVVGGAGAELREATQIVFAPLHEPSRLAWRVGLTVDFAHAWRVLVDAQDGRVLRRYNLCTEANVPGTGTDLTGKSRSLNVWSADGKFTMIDTTKSMFNPAFDPIQDPHGAISIFDAREVSSKELKTVYLVESASANQWLPDAVSALVNFDATYDYYLAQHGRISLDGNGGNIQAAVRIGQLDNAFWSGDAKMMFFGNVRPYAEALDVVGHELTHGVTQFAADLIYELQPGAMNEAFSDIFGEMVEARTVGQPDWLMGQSLGEAFRDMKNPGNIKFGDKPLPGKMSEYFDLPNDANSDHGGVHINSSIINHAFYLTAAGLPNAVGLGDAEKIFYRCLTRHLQKQSQFIDARLGCIASAEELFGAGSAQAKAVADAFDQVEIFDRPATPEPSPIPVVQGPDSAVFIGWDPFYGQIALGRYEQAKGDPEGGIALVESVQNRRPAVSGDGSFVLFVDSAYDLCGVETADPNTLACTGYRGYVHSVAVSPDARLYAFVLRDPLTGQAQNQINVYDYPNDSVRSYKLVAPVLDSTPVDSVLYADSMSFTSDSKQLVYDALTELRFGTGGTVQRWSIFRLDLATETTTVLVPPQEGADFGNPSLGRTGSRYLAFDARATANGNSAVVVADLFTGNAAVVATVANGLGFPSFTGDDSAIVFSAPDRGAFYTGFSLYRQALTEDRLGASGQPAVWVQDSPVGVVYRRGEYISSNSLPSVALAAPVNGATFPAGASISLTATAADADGGVAKVEFYSGSDKLGEKAGPPYSYTWSGAPAGSYRLIARAIDNLGASSDSPAVTISVGAPAGPVTLSADWAANRGLRIRLRGPAGNYTLQTSSDLRQWSDANRVVVDETGVGEVSSAVAATGGQFFRVRRE